MTIKEMRDSLGISQAAFGELFGIPRRTIQNWEIGIRKPPDYVINLIEKNLMLIKKVVKLEGEIEVLKTTCSNTQ